MTIARRTLMGKGSTLSSRLRVFRTPDAVEVDEIEGYDVTRRRVRFDEVLLVTYHRTLGWPFVVVMLAFMTLAASVSAVIWVADRSMHSLAWVLVLPVPFLILIALRFALRVDVVTVYGIRTRAEMQFWFRKGKARQAYQQVCRLARERQQKVRNVPVARRPAPPPPPSALPPPLPEPFA